MRVYSQLEKEIIRGLIAIYNEVCLIAGHLAPHG
jgi:hypothetical protein